MDGYDYSVQPGQNTAGGPMVPQYDNRFAMIAQGWLCPRCNAINNPNQMQCPTCWRSASLYDYTITWGAGSGSDRPDGGVAGESQQEYFGIR